MVNFTQVVFSEYIGFLSIDARVVDEVVWIYVVIGVSLVGGLVEEVKQNVCEEREFQIAFFPMRHANFSVISAGFEIKF